MGRLRLRWLLSIDGLVVFSHLFAFFLDTRLARVYDLFSRRCRFSQFPLVLLPCGGFVVFDQGVFSFLLCTLDDTRRLTLASRKVENQYMSVDCEVSRDAGSCA
ncbi:hypothetical protein HDK77DRAFT_442092 [Phyllosticta capitalensis]